MILGASRSIGKAIAQLEIGDTLNITEKIEDQDLLLYLGLTNDNNPLYIQHDYAAQTSFEKPVVPTIMLTGIVTSTISKHLPGPGSHIIQQELQFPTPVYHYETIQCQLSIIEIDTEKDYVVIEVNATNDRDQIVLTGKVIVIPPKYVS